MIAELIAKIRFLMRRRKPAELDEELAFHIEQAIAANIDAGMHPIEARRQAMIGFGGMETTREAMYEARPGAFFETLTQDIRYALRGFSRNPALVITVAVTLALGIGANATIFSMISRFVLHSAPVRDPATLVDLRTTHDHEQCCNEFSWPLYKDVRDQSKSFSSIAAYDDMLPASIGGSGNPEHVWGQAATVNFFDVAGIPMKLGRGFQPDEDQRDVVVLGERLWERDFSSDPSIIGRKIQLSGHPFTVIGVAPNGFRGIDPILSMEFWIPLGGIERFGTTMPSRDTRDYHWLAVIGRLAPGVSRAQAKAELATLAKHIDKIDPETDAGQGFHLDAAGALPPRSQPVVRLFLGTLAVIVLLVLAIACANVTNLLLARAAGRQREMAVRVALGATRMRLLRQMLVESLMLALMGGVISTALSWWATHALSSFHMPAPVPLDLSVSIDGRVLVCVFVLSTASGLLFGFVPGWLVSRPVLSKALRGEAIQLRSGRRFNLRSALVVAQISMSLVLLCATGLFLRSLQKAAEIGTGFRSKNLLIATVDPRTLGYSPQRTLTFLSELRVRTAALPGVRSVSMTDMVQLSGGGRSDGFFLEGQDKPGVQGKSTDEYMVTPGYFETMGIPLLAGHDFTEGIAGPAAAVVNLSFARYFFASASPIGQRVTGDGVTYQIIGIVSDTKSRTVGEPTRLVLYRSLAQTLPHESSELGYFLLIHPGGSGEGILDAVKDEARQLDPAVAVYNTRRIEDHLRDALFLPRLAGALFTVFGVLGLALASVGLYGVTSYSVSQQTKEIGIRMALGAERGAVERLILRRGMAMTLLAMAIGWPAALAAAKFAQSFLYGIPARDAVTFGVVPAALFAVTFIACWLPARRAAKVNPQIALRHE
ncbi:ADOP family duplicated permease [Silvibacterium acidisoli]|uniref:ADOP family duplicated permease n=1 Tax=Acidobacteriaceae bacterium ZG23-2 TaxID=2883246 RepID=UPI00406C946E